MPNCISCGSWAPGTICHACAQQASSKAFGSRAARCQRCAMPTRNKSGYCDGCMNVVNPSGTAACGLCGRPQHICSCLICTQCIQLTLKADISPFSGICRTCGQTRQQQTSSPFRRPTGSWYRGTSPSGASPNMARGAARIWWDPQVAAYKLITPFNNAFVETLKSLIPASDRVWDPEAKQWTFHEAYLDPIKTLCQKVFGSTPTVMTKQQVEAAAPAGSQGGHQMSTTKGNPLDVTLCSFMRLLSYDAARAAYRKAALELHPDTQNGDSSKMSDLNMAWARIEKDLYGR